MYGAKEIRNQFGWKETWAAVFRLSCGLIGWKETKESFVKWVTEETIWRSMLRQPCFGCYSVKTDILVLKLFMLQLLWLSNQISERWFPQLTTTIIDKKKGNYNYIMRSIFS